MSNDIQDFLDSAGGGSTPSASLDNPGDSVRGVITNLDQRQMKDFDTKELETWPNGEPKMQLIVTVQTDERDPAIEDDDGQRNIYAPKDNRESSKFQAIADAVKATRSAISVGATLALVYTEDAPKAKGAARGRKLYQAAYKPAEATGAAALLDTAAPAGEPFPTPAAAAPATPAVSAADLL